MSTTNNMMKPELIFNEIIKKRVADYIDIEVKAMVNRKTNEIIESVLSDLQVDAKAYLDMARYETNIIVKAIYNGKDILQKDVK